MQTGWIRDANRIQLHTPRRETNALIQPLRIRGRVADTQMEGCNFR
jgi:hypothetical protein